jgi:hypothetical protein
MVNRVTKMGANSPIGFAHWVIVYLNGKTEWGHIFYGKENGLG